MEGDKVGVGFGLTSRASRVGSTGMALVIARKANVVARMLVSCMFADRDVYLVFKGVAENGIVLCCYCVRCWSDDHSSVALSSPFIHFTFYARSRYNTLMVLHPCSSSL